MDTIRLYPAAHDPLMRRYNSPLNCISLLLLLLGTLQSKHKVEGLIFYFPFLRGKETRPSLPTHYESASMRIKANNKRGSSSYPKQRVSAGKGLSQKGHSQSQSRKAIVIDADDDEGDSSDDMEDYNGDALDEEERHEKKKREAQSKNICIYWQNRLVPETGIDRLPFFPIARSRFQCCMEGIPENWRGRIKGFLFFNNKFTHISNNKLRLQVDPDLETWLEKKFKEKAASCDITKVDGTFSKWLQECHSSYDRDFLFNERDVEREKAEKLLGSVSVWNGSTPVVPFLTQTLSTVTRCLHVSRCLCL
jgi:hypothetical protein